MSKKDEMKLETACECLAMCLVDAIGALNKINAAGRGGADYPYEEESPQLARWRRCIMNDEAREARNDAAEVIWNENIPNAEVTGAPTTGANKGEEA